MADGHAPANRRRAILLTLAVTFGVLGVAGALAGLRLAGAARDLRAASDLLEDAGDLIEDGRISEARVLLADARTQLTGAMNAVHGHAELSVLSAVPFLADDLDQVRDSIGLAATLVNGGERILRAAEPLADANGELEVPLAAGAIPLDAVRTAGREAELLAGALPGRAESEGRAHLLGPVRELRDRVLDESERRKTQLGALAGGLELITDMAGGNGPRRYLIAVANTAEMRGSGGMVLNYGVLVGAGGDFELETFERIDGLLLTEPVPSYLVPVPTDYLARWAGFEPLQLWRNANLGADFAQTAPALEAMYTAATGTLSSGVIQIDPYGLAAILQGIGPVEVPGLGTVTAENVVDLVLNRTYVEFPDVGERTDVLGDVAEATFRKLVGGEYDSLRPLAEALLGAVDGRHILMHSVPAGPQDSLHYFGADGALPPLDGPDALHLTVQNVSANKLDYYVDTALDLTGDREPGALGHVRATITVSNTAPAGVTSPRYIFGPFNEDQVAGLYRGSVSLYLPAGTRLLGSGGDPIPDAPTITTESGRPVVGFRVDVPAGARRSVTLDLELAPRAPGAYDLVVVPSPRVRPTQLSVALSGDGGVAGTVALDRTWRFRGGAEPVPLAPPSGRLPTGRGR